MECLPGSLVPRVARRCWSLSVAPGLVTANKSCSEMAPETPALVCHHDEALLLSGRSGGSVKQAVLFSLKCRQSIHQFAKHLGVWFYNKLLPIHE